MRLTALISVLLIYRIASLKTAIQSLRRSTVSFALLPRKASTGSSSREVENIENLKNLTLWLHNETLVLVNFIEVDGLISPTNLGNYLKWTAGRTSTVNSVKGASAIIRKKSKEEEEVKEVESVDEQLKKMETAANANRSEWEAQLKAKLGTWNTSDGCWESHRIRNIN